MTNTKSDLEDRLVDFAVQVIKIAENLPNTKTGNHIAGQIIRSSTSPALNYGEAQDAESTAARTSYDQSTALKSFKYCCCWGFR